MALRGKAACPCLEEAAGSLPAWEATFSGSGGLVVCGPRGTLTSEKHLQPLGPVPLRSLRQAPGLQHRMDWAQNVLWGLLLGLSCTCSKQPSKLVYSGSYWLTAVFMMEIEN